jgi:hypothetical protein
VPEPIATWNPARGVWERPEMNILCGHSALYSETWPTSGMTRGGQLYPLPTPEHRTDVSECSSSPDLLPTPRPQVGGGCASVDLNYAERGFRPNLMTVVSELLPTPVVTNRAGMSPSQSSIDGKRGTDLGPAIGALLKTPTAQLAVNGGSQHPDKRRAGGHGPTLADQVECELLPTPSAALAAGGQTSRSGDRIGEPLLPAIAKLITGGGALLPTPAARDWKSGQSNLIGTNARPLNEVVEMLLPTPTARVRGGSNCRHGDTTRGDDLPEAVKYLPTPSATDYKGSGQTQGRERGGRPRPPGDVDLPEAVALLPTPMAADGDRMSATMPRGNPTLIGALTASPSVAGNESPAAQLPGQLSLDEPGSD